MKSPELYLKTSPNGVLKQESISEVIDLITFMTLNDSSGYL